jgi:hypothetical protein
MFKSTQILFSATLIAFLFIFLFITPYSARACAEEPQTLLSLYLNSDVIILADYESAKILEKEDTTEYGYWQKLQSTLKVLRIFKGQKDLEKVSFIKHEYHSLETTPAESDELSEDYDSEYETEVNVEDIKPGDRYLFFLTKDQEDGENYVLTDYMSGVKDVSGKLDVYEKSLNELRSISESKENQNARLIEWLVKSIEEPVTRQDGINDLAESFYSMNYAPEEENSEEPNEPTPLDENFSINLSQVAKNLSDSQKYRISSVLYSMLQQSWFSPKPEYANYGIAAILGSFDKPQLAIYSFSMLRNIDEQDFERRKMVMSFISDVIGDEDLNSVYYEFMDIDYELTSSENKKTTEELKVINEKRNTLMKNFDKRFEFMMARNFQPVTEKK